MSTPAHRYLVALGSNLGERLAFLQQAAAAIKADIGQVTAHAGYYATQPLGAADQPFINSALVVLTQLPPEAMLQSLMGIETRLGRVRRERWGNRIIDLDILLWQHWADHAWHSAACDSATLRVPHPHLLQRDFALVPAAEIAGDWWHPEAHTRLDQAVIAQGFYLPALP